MNCHYRSLSPLLLIILISLGCMGYFILVNKAGKASLAAEAGQGSSLVFFALGDQGTGDGYQKAVAKAMEEVARESQKVDFILLLGDNFYANGVESVNDEQWQEKFEHIYDEPFLSKIPFYALLGNHDHGTNIQAQIDYAAGRRGSGRWRMKGRHYAEDFGAIGGRPLVRIVFLDTTPGEPVAPQTEQLRRAFNENKPEPIWKIAAGHHPIRSFGKHGPTEELFKWLLPVLKEVQVHLYLSGHDHALQVIESPGEPLYVVSGGGGKDLYPLQKGDQSLKFGAQTHGFVRISASPSALSIKAFDGKSQPLYTHVLAFQPNR